VSDRFSAYNYFPLEQRQLCWAHLTAISPPPLTVTAPAVRLDGAAGPAAAGNCPVAPVEGRDDRLSDVAQGCQPIRQAFMGTLQRVVELGSQRGERTPWTKTVGTCRQLLLVADGLWTFLEIKGIDPPTILQIEPCAIR
jgi:transposase